MDRRRRRPGGRLRRAGRQDGQAGPARASSSCSRESGELDGEPTADHPPGQVLREGRPPARDRHQPPVVHPQRRPRRRPARRAAAAGQGAALAPAATCRSASRTGSNGLNGDWLISPPALLRRAVPGLVPARRRRRARPRPRRSLADEAALPVDPSTDAPAGFDESQRGQPGGFVGDPDVMDTWATSSLTPQIATGWERGPRPVRPHLPDGPAPAGPRDHPHLAVLHRRCAPTSSTTRCRGRNAAHLGLGPRPRPQEDVEVEGQRRHAARPSSSSTAPTPCATGPPAAAPAPTPRSTRAR